MNGLSAIRENGKLVAIHDGARPVVSSLTVSDTLAVARETGAAVAAHKVTDTLKHADSEERIAANVDRTNLWAVQTPQVFRLEIIRQAMTAARERGATMTDDTAACELIGQPVTLVSAAEPNPKVTTPADLPLVELLLGR